MPPPTNKTYCDMPMCECPHCHGKFQWDDYYDVEAGSQHDCPKCDKVIHVTFVDHTINVVLGTEKED